LTFKWAKGWKLRRRKGGFRHILKRLRGPAVSREWREKGEEGRSGRSAIRLAAIKQPGRKKREEKKSKRIETGLKRQRKRKPLENENKGGREGKRGEINWKGVTSRWRKRRGFAQ